MPFLQLSRLLGQGIATPVNGPLSALILQCQPEEIAWILERVWQARRNGVPVNAPVRPAGGSLLPQNPGAVLPALQLAGYFAGIMDWHLIYAYLVENTRIYSIVGRVLDRFNNGETLGVPQIPAQLWARTTEELFFRDPAPFFSFTVTSRLRPDPASGRRTLFYRLFGLDLNHQTDDKSPIQYERVTIANREFIPTFEELLRETWAGIENANNLIGPNATSDASLRLLIVKLRDMLLARRLFGNISREEFYHVATMAWMHLTVSDNASPLVQSLSAFSTSDAGRLMQISQKVGTPMHSKAHHFFELSERIAMLLINIETGFFNPPLTEQLLYLPGPLRILMENIISHWSMATGRDIKSQRPTVSALRGASAERAVVRV